MKKLMQLIQEEIVPLSRRQNIVLLTIIACIFQFVLFYAPALAEEAVQEANAQGLQEEMIVGVEVIKDQNMDSEAAKLKPANGMVATEVMAAEIDINPIAEIDINPIAETENKSFGPENKPTDLYRVVKTSTHTMTAYNSEAAQTDSTPCITANGFNVCNHGIEDTVAANFLPMGTKIRIPDLFGDRVFTVRDRMNKRYSDRVDIWMLHKTDALKFGVRKARIEVLAEIK